MPRKARQKCPEAIFHIMCRSQSEIFLFRDDSDKDYYLGLLKKYTERFNCSVYAYCLMDNHLHMHFDPKGFDVSKFMHRLNTAYVRYYNKKYQRHGHVFQDRFESRILDTVQYNLAVSAYIHNNPHAIPGFSGKEETYRYSSYGIYLGIVQDFHHLVDRSFIMGLCNTDDPIKLSEKYFAFVSHQRDVGSFRDMKNKLSSAVEYEYVSGRRVILRDIQPAKVISFLWGKLLILKKEKIKASRKKFTELRAVTAYILQLLCGLTYKEICNHLYNITISGCSRLCSRGYELIRKENSIYSSLLFELSNCHI